MKDVKPRVKVPKSAKAGEVVTVKTLISHPMESGQRKDKDGKVIPREIINRFTCDFNGVNVIDIAIDPAVSTNPYFEFDAHGRRGGRVQVHLVRRRWRDLRGRQADRGFVTGPGRPAGAVRTRGRR